MSASTEGLVGEAGLAPRGGAGAGPYGDPVTVLVTAVGEAEGARGAAAALACAGADLDRAALLVDLGGRAPRPTLLASAAAQRLEERLAAHLPEVGAAARGQVCHLALPAAAGAFEAVSAAVAVVRGAAPGGRGAFSVVHLPPHLLQSFLGAPAAPPPTGVLLRAELGADRDLLSLAVRDVQARGLDVAAQKRRLSWVVERRALFGALPPDAAGGLPATVRRRLLREVALASGGGPLRPAGPAQSRATPPANGAP